MFRESELINVVHIIWASSFSCSHRLSKEMVRSGNGQVVEKKKITTDQLTLITITSLMLSPISHYFVMKPSHLHTLRDQAVTLTAILSSIAIFALL